MDTSSGLSRATIANGSRAFDIRGMAANVTDSFGDFGNNTNMFYIPVYIYVWVTILNVLVFIVGAVGNILVIFVVCRVRDMKTSTNYCLMNLSIADLLVLLVCQPAALFHFYGLERWFLGTFMCKMVAFLENMVTHASILIIMAISFGRFYAVCYPLKAYSGSNSRRKMIMIAAMWIFAVAWALPFFFMAQTQKEYHFAYREYVDTCTTLIDQEWKKVFVLLIMCLFFVVPFAMLIIVYIVIILRVVINSMSSKDNADSKKTQSSDSNKQLVCMLIGIILLFFVSLLPFRILVLMYMYSPHVINNLDMESYLNLTNAVRLLVFINSAGNPLIYNIVSSKFRAAFKKTLTCRSGKHKEGLRLTTMTHYSYMHTTNVDPI